MAGQRKRRTGETGNVPGGGGSGGEGDEPLSEARLLLERAIELIGERSAWTRRQFARDRHSKPVSPWSERAVRFCVGGALLRATQEQLDVQFRLARPGEPPDAESEDDAQLAPLQEAYRLLGRAMEALFLLPSGLRVREERRGEEVRIFLVDADGKAPEGWAPENSMTWRSLVHVLNDDRQLGRSHILGALSLATLFTYSDTSPHEGGSS